MGPADHGNQHARQPPLEHSRPDQAEQRHRPTPRSHPCPPRPRTWLRRGLQVGPRLAALGPLLHAGGCQLERSDHAGQQGLGAVRRFVRPLLLQLLEVVAAHHAHLACVVVPLVVLVLAAVVAAVAVPAAALLPLLLARA